MKTSYLYRKDCTPLSLPPIQAEDPVLRDADWKPRKGQNANRFAALEHGDAMEAEAQAEQAPRRTAAMTPQNTPIRLLKVSETSEAIRSPSEVVKPQAGRSAPTGLVASILRDSQLRRLGRALLLDTRKRAPTLNPLKKNNTRDMVAWSWHQQATT